METTNTPHSASIADDDHIPASQRWIETTRKIMRGLVSALLRTARRAHQACLDYRQRRAAYRELAALDARTLHDIGVSLSDIDAIANGSFSDDDSRYRRHVSISSRHAAPIVSWRECSRPGIASSDAKQ